MDTGEGLTKTFKIPISFLDYDHIEKCTNVLELEKIYLTLKTGEEGKYPDLETFCEKRLQKLSPNSRVLRKATELVSLNQLDGPLRQEIMNDFQSWVDEIQLIDQSLKRQTPSNNGDNENVHNFPIRTKQDISSAQLKTNNPKTNKSCKPKDYNEWSKIADELEKQMILEEKEISKGVSTEFKVQKPKDCKDFKGLPNKVETTNMSNLEKEKAALFEKEKGNEAFKAGDLDEAITYYTRSLSIAPFSAVYNNRGLVYMKQKKWEEAIHDLSLTLKKDSSNIKAMQRRATCYSEIHNLQDAIVDCQKILKLNPNNKFAKNLLATSQAELEKRAKPKLKDGKRMIITEIESDEESSNEDDNEEKFTIISTEEKEQDEKKESENKEPVSVLPVLDNKSDEEFMSIKDYGNQLFKELKYEEALRIYDKLVENWPSNPIGYRNRAACNLVLERPLDVIKDCTIAIDLDKNSHLSFYRRGKAYKILKQHEKSVSDLEEALKISPNHIQIKDELNEVRLLLEEKMICKSESPFDEICIQNDLDEVIDITNEEIIPLKADIHDNIDQDASSTWEFLGHCEVSDDFSKDSCDSSSLIEKSNTKSMTKHEFDKQLNNIRVRSDWKSTIQLLVDVGPSNLSLMIGTKLDGFILEKIISSLLTYSKIKPNPSFIKSVLDGLTKVERFCFVKMMISDHALSELNELFKILKQNSSNLAEIDCLQHQYQ